MPFGQCAVKARQFALVQEGIQKQRPDRQRHQSREAAADPGALAQNVAAYTVFAYLAAEADGDFGSQLKE